jgi:hypothetical protein
MRLIALSVLVGSMVAAPMANVHAASWTSAKIPGEQNQAVQGCADDPEKAGDWLCVIVRCDQPGAPLSLHFTAPAPDIQGNIKLLIDKDSFALSVPASLKSPLPLSTRAESIPDALLESMKSGSAIVIEGSRLQPPHNRISLENSRKAIERIEYTCMRPYPGAAGFWRRLTRGYFY